MFISNNLCNLIYLIWYKIYQINVILFFLFLVVPIYFYKNSWLANIISFYTQLFLSLFLLLILIQFYKCSLNLIHIQKKSHFLSWINIKYYIYCFKYRRHEDYNALRVGLSHKIVYRFTFLPHDNLKFITITIIF